MDERHARADAACPRVIAPYFYAIENHGRVSHILGTRHAGVPLSKFPASIRATIDVARLAVFEIAPGDDSPDPATPDQSISQLLGPSLWNHYRELVGSDAADGVEHGSPMLAMILLTAEPEDLTASLDLQLEQAAAAANIPTAGLEADAFQAQLLARLFDLRMLKASIANTKDRAELEREAADDLRDYCAGIDDQPGFKGDERAHLLAAGYSAADVDAIDEEVVFARNERWIPQLETMFKTAGVFVAVGADHLKGPRGVIALLKARGFHITRVKP